MTNFAVLDGNFWTFQIPFYLIGLSLLVATRVDGQRTVFWCWIANVEICMAFIFLVGLISSSFGLGNGFCWPYAARWQYDGQGSCFWHFSFDFGFGFASDFGVGSGFGFDFGVDLISYFLFYST